MKLYRVTMEGGVRVKTCTACKVAKPASEYPSRRFAGRCKPCSAARQRELYAPKERPRAVVCGPDGPSKKCTDCGELKTLSQYSDQKSWNGKVYPVGRCKSCTSARQRAKYAANREELRADNWRVQLKSKYGITPEDYDSMLESQGGRCAICRTDTPGRNGHRRFHVDHCHETGAVRGLLCSSCNTGLGRFKDDPDLLLKAIEYLRSE